MVPPGRIIALSLLLAFALPAQPRAQTANPYAENSSWTIGMITGAVQATSLRMANDTALVRFFTKIDEFRRPGQHPKWREAALSAPVAGWTRFPAAQQWLKSYPEAVAAKTNTVAAGEIDFGRLQNFAVADEPEARNIKLLFANYQRSRGSNGTENSEKLFNEFMRWYQKSERKLSRGGVRGLRISAAF